MKTHRHNHFPLHMANGRIFYIGESNIQYWHQFLYNMHRMHTSIEKETKLRLGKSDNCRIGKSTNSLISQRVSLLWQFRLRKIHKFACHRRCPRCCYYWVSNLSWESVLRIYQNTVNFVRYKLILSFDICSFPYQTKVMNGRIANRDFFPQIYCVVNICATKNAFIACIKWIV